MIEGVKFVELKAHVDDRGYLIEILRANDEYFSKFGQVYLVGNFSKGTIRAFHKHNILWDWFFISHGSAKFVLIDDRKASPTFKSIDTFIVSSRNPSLIAVPPGVYHGWMSLEDDTQMVSIASEIYNRQAPDEVRIPYDTFGDLWSVKPR
ncbi:MAG: dTDP-4-dehydrorhamnose 3,5-epimerase family protein [Candidatus Omnitrophica bacterium]|nr:dTDP-4-dehydrorhamnose 3,5-epimerase family protein [Candidatus Omnitrophota bacterium]